MAKKARKMMSLHIDGETALDMPPIVFTIRDAKTGKTRRLAVKQGVNGLHIALEGFSDEKRAMDIWCWNGVWCVDMWNEVDEDPVCRVDFKKRLEVDVAPDHIPPRKEGEIIKC